MYITIGIRSLSRAKKENIFSISQDFKRGKIKASTLEMIPISFYVEFLETNFISEFLLEKKLIKFKKQMVQIRF